MYFWNAREISSKEYHVIETRFEGEPEFILARCSGPVPAWEIIRAMRISQSLRLNKDSIHNAVFRIKSALEIFDAEIKNASNEQPAPAPATSGADRVIECGVYATCYRHVHHRCTRWDKKLCKPTTPATNNSTKNKESL